MVQETQFNVAEVEVSYKADYKIIDRPKISQSSMAYAILKQQWDSNRIELLEEFKIILLNTSNRVLGIADISKGGVSGILIDPKIVFAIALKTNSSKIILSHNHPSGNLQPSSAILLLPKD